MDTHTLRYLRGEAMRDFDDGKVPDAEAKLTELISQSENATDPWTAGEVASCLRDRATVRRYSNRWQEALDDLSRCERVAMRLPGLARRMTLPNVYYMRALLLGTPYSDVYDPSAAQRAIAEFRKYPGPPWIASSMEADIAFHQRTWDKAAALYLRTSESLEREGWAQGVAGCRLRAGECFVELRDWVAAEREIDASLAFLEKSGPPDMLAAARLNLARIRSAQDEPDAAWDLALSALSGIESLVRLFRDVTEQQKFLANKLRFYDHAFEIARVKSGAEGKWRAWSIAERAKSFYLCQLVANADIELFEGIGADEIARLKCFESQLDDAERQFANLPPQDKLGTPGQDLELGIKTISQQKRDLLSMLMKRNPRWAALRTPPPFDIKSELAKLKAHWIIVSYFWVAATDSKNSWLHIFWTGSDRSPHSLAVSWTPDDLKVLDDLHSLLRGTVSPGEDTFPRKLGPKVLPAAMLDSLATDSQMLISPHERLKGIPLQTVPVHDDQLLIQKVPVQFIPTLTLLTLRSKADAAEQILLLGCPTNGFGDPPLEAVETEIASIAKIWDAQRPGKVKDRILPADARLEMHDLGPNHWSDFGIVHIACHGVFKEGMPFDAALRLGSDAVRASELFSAHLANAGVFLSACSLGRQEVGSGKPTAGDEWIGLYLPIFYSGAQHLLVSLYDADSETAMRVMVDLHTALSNGVGLASALQSAIGAAMDEGRPPALWANWYLVGLPA